MGSKALIFDSSTLINFGLNGLLYLLAELKERFGGKFLITKDVKYETVDRPRNVKKFELNALKINTLIANHVLEMPSAMGIDEQEIVKEAKRILRTANHTFKAKERWIHLIDKGEASCLALSFLLNERGIENIIAIDERTTRMLCEKPENLRELMENKLHTKLEAVEKNYAMFKNFKIIRSSELLYIAYKYGLVKLHDHGSEVLDALLYGAKFKGCAISREEIDEIKEIAREKE